MLEVGHFVDSDALLREALPGLLSFGSLSLSLSFKARRKLQTVRIGSSTFSQAALCIS